MIEVRILGGLSIDRVSATGGRQPLKLTPQAAAVLVHLLVARGGEPLFRDQLLAVFWPEVPETRARASLSQVIYRLRRDLGAEAVVTSGDTVVGVDSARVRCDLLDLHSLLDRGVIETALRLYRGPFLHGFHGVSGGEFEQWADVERQRTARRVESAARLFSEGADAQAADARITTLLLAHSCAPFDEEIARRLVRSLLEAGNRAGAAETYRAFVRRLDEELGTSPAPETRALEPLLRTDMVAPVAPPAGTIRVVAQPERTPAPPRDAAVPTRRRRLTMPGLRGWSATAAGMLAIAATLYVLSGGRDASANRPGARVRVGVAAFENRTGERGLDKLAVIAGDWIASELLRSGRVQVVPYSTTLRRLRQSGDTPASRERVARQLASESGAQLVVLGAYALAGDSIHFRIEIVDRDGSLLRVLDRLSAPRSAPDLLVREVGDRTTGALLTHLDPRQKRWAGAASQPPSYGAYQRFADGLDHFVGGAYDSAIVQFAAAASIDSTYVSPLLWQALAYHWMNQHGRMRAAIDPLLARRDGLRPWDRAMLDYLLAQESSDFSGAYSALQRMEQVAPASEWSYLLAGAAMRVGRAAEALQLLRQAGPGLAEDWFPYHTAVVNALHQVGDFDAELAEIRGQEPNCCARAELRALAASGRYDELQARAATFASVQSSPSARLAVWREIADELRAHRQVNRARTFSDRAFREALEVARIGDSSDSTYALARAHYFAENWKQARDLFLRVNPEQRGDPTLHAAVAAAALGDRPAAEEMLERLRQDPARNTWWNIIWEARILARLGESDRALDLLRRGVVNGRVGVFPWLHADFALGPLLDHPGFRQILQASR